MPDLGEIRDYCKGRQHVNKILEGLSGSESRTIVEEDWRKEENFRTVDGALKDSGGHLF